jgi:hypothetical protein
MTDFPEYPRAPRDNTNPDFHRRQLARTVNSAVSGKTNNVGEITLTENAASTTLSDVRLTYFSNVYFEPLTANAAAEKANGTMYAAAGDRNNLEWTITHANNAQTDRTFRYAIIG